jgi:hypothetical protein
MPKDKWFGISQKTKELWDQIDDNDKLVILGYTKSSSLSSYSSRSPGKPPFPPKQCHSINLHEMSIYEFLQVHTHELKPDPAPDEAITANSFILNHDLKRMSNGERFLNWNLLLKRLVTASMQ